MGPEEIKRMLGALSSRSNKEELFEITESKENNRSQGLGRPSRRALYYGKGDAGNGI
jgi:hypothetical protein